MLHTQGHTRAHGHLCIIHVPTPALSHPVLEAWRTRSPGTTAVRVSEVTPLSTEFEEPRVIDLWDLAQSANFSEKELEAFRVSRVQGLPVLSSPWQLGRGCSLFISNCSYGPSQGLLVPTSPSAPLHPPHLQ